MKNAWIFSVLASCTLAAGAASPIETFLDKGKVTALYGSDMPSDPLHLADTIKRSNLAERMAAVASSSLLLRHDLQVTFDSCGKPNAYFSPQRSTIVICYEFVELMSKLAVADKKMMELPKDQFARVFNGALWSVYLHELGHAVVHINRVPITGREEDVADQFGAWFAINFMPLDRVPIITPSLWLWTRFAQARDLPSMSEEQRRMFLANEHSLDEQRVYNIACMAIGARPDSATSLLSAVKLPESRAQRCPSEYEQVNFAMQKGFRKFFKVKPLRGSW
jgi:hypothetical protein